MEEYVCVPTGYRASRDTVMETPGTVVRTLSGVGVGGDRKWTTADILCTSIVLMFVK
jgi:hypothetical protein